MGPQQASQSYRSRRERERELEGSPNLIDECGVTEANGVTEAAMEADGERLQLRNGSYTVCQPATERRSIACFTSFT
jgi:hypothetical protein